MCVDVSQFVLRKQYLEFTWKQTFEELGQKEEPQPSSDLSESPVVVQLWSLRQEMSQGYHG